MNQPRPYLCEYVKSRRSRSYSMLTVSPLTETHSPVPVFLPGEWMQSSEIAAMQTQFDTRHFEAIQLAGGISILYVPHCFLCNASKWPPRCLCCVGSFIFSQRPFQSIFVGVTFVLFNWKVIPSMLYSITYFFPLLCRCWTSILAEGATFPIRLILQF